MMMMMMNQFVAWIQDRYQEGFGIICVLGIASIWSHQCMIELDENGWIPAWCVTDERAHWCDAKQQEGFIDYDALDELVTRVVPKLVICGGSAYPRDWDYARIRQIVDKVGAYFMCDMAHYAGLVAGKVCTPNTHTHTHTHTHTLSLSLSPPSKY
jgi:hypothetical protein